MNFESSVCKWPLLMWSFITLATVPAFAVNIPMSDPDDKDVIVSTEPMEIEADGATGAYGQLLVASEILSDETGNDLVYTIVEEPRHGRVGLAGSDDEDEIFQTKTSRVGYFAYRPDDDYTGTDSFTYTVRNEISGSC